MSLLRFQNFIKKRKIVVYLRNGKIEYYENISGDTILHFDGLKVKKIIVNSLVQFLNRQHIQLQITALKKRELES